MNAEKVPKAQIAWEERIRQLPLDLHDVYRRHAKELRNEFIAGYAAGQAASGRDVITKHWQTWGDDCPVCGGEGEVFTIARAPHTGYDQEEARCAECHCPGMMVVNDDAYIAWNIDNHELGCGCEWCKRAGGERNEDE